MIKKNTRRLFCLTLITLMLICQCAPVMAAENEALKTVRVSCGINKALYIDDDGEPTGYCAEYIQDLAAINNWNIEYVEGSWTESVENLKNGKIDILFPTQMTEERKSTMGFSGGIGGYQPIGLYADANSKLCYDDYEGFDGAKVALSAGTSNEASLNKYAEEHDFSFTPVYLNTTDEKMAALKDGTVDLIVFSTLNDVPDGKVVAMLDYLPFYYCTNIKNTQLLDELNFGMNQMIIRHPDIVENVFYNFMNKNINFAYTKEEEEEIKEKGSITVGVYDDMDPLFGVDKDGNYVGIYADIIHRIEKSSGLKIEVKVIDRRKNIFDYLNKGDIDFLLGFTDEYVKQSGNSDYLVSEGIMDYYSIDITKSDFSKKSDEQVEFALTDGRFFMENMIKKRYPKATFSYYDSSKECLDAVQSGKADITIMNSWEYNYHSKNQRYEDLIEWENSRTLSEAVFISLSNENILIRSVLNKAIDQISNAEKEGIITSNLNRPYDAYSFKDRIYEMRQTLLISIAILIIAIIVLAMRRKNTKALEEKNHELEDANKTKDNFLSRMSHELRTPLNAINGYATVLEQNLDNREFDKEDVKNNIESILRASKYQLAIISDLLDIQKIELGNIELHPAETDIDDLMKSMFDMIKSEADEKHIDFRYNKLTNFSNSYILDSVRFHQVMLNLLYNSIKFTPEGGIIRMTAEVIDHDQATSTLKFVVADNGIGMSEDFQENYLFHRFAQEYKGNTSPYEGCGIGLAISKDIVHLMGGEITCTSQQGVGSTFTVIITAKNSVKNSTRRKRTQMNYDLSGIKVLLCEDNPMNQDIERRILEKMKCQVEIADDGQIGLDKFVASNEDDFDIILMDIRMPNMDGLSAARAIRQLDRPDGSKIPILAVSANAFEEDVKKSLAAGMNEHLAKPVDAKILYEKIKTYVNREEGLDI